MTVVAVVERVPPDLISAMREFHGLIESHNVRATTPADDLLQSDNVYGGLLEWGGNEFAFCYMPLLATEGPPYVKWWLKLTADQISRIANGKIHELQLWRCEPDCRCRIMIPDGDCEICGNQL